MTGKAYVTAVVQQVVRERLGVLPSSHPQHPFNSPDWFGRVQTSIPAPIFTRLCAQAAGRLAGEHAFAAQWRAQQAFAHVGR